IKTQGQSTPQHSIVDPSYLALVGDQSLRTTIIAGHLDDNAPDWRSYISGHALSSQEITDIVAWIAEHRRQTQSSVLSSGAANPPAPAKSGTAMTKTATSSGASPSSVSKEN